MENKVSNGTNSEIIFETFAVITMAKKRNGFFSTTEFCKQFGNIMFPKSYENPDHEKCISYWFESLFGSDTFPGIHI